MGKTYYPAKTFDDDCSALADHFARKKWAFSGVSETKALLKDAADQRAERKEFDDAAIAFEGLKQRFGENQHERFTRYSEALGAARGAFKNNKGEMAQLKRFKRRFATSSPKKEDGNGNGNGNGGGNGGGGSEP